jgi:hypothetical protein
MSTASAALQKIDNSTRRADSLLAEIERRERQRQADDIAQRDRADAAKARADSEKCRQVQVKYADAFSSFGVQTPAPFEGERPGRYRQRLYEYLRKKLPSNHDLFSVRADDIPAGDAARNFETMMIEAAMAEGLRPSAENLPASGELVRRERADEMGTRSIEWLGRESFVKQMGNPLKQRVVRFIDRRNGNAVLWGEPFSRIER